MKCRLGWIVLVFLGIFPGIACEQTIGSPMGDVPVPTNGRVIRASIAELSPSAQKFLLPQLAKFGLRSGTMESIVSARAQNQPRENLDATVARVRYADGYAKSANSNVNAFGHFSVQLVNLKDTPFAGYEFLGYVPEGTIAGGPYSWVARVFRTPVGNSLVLSEWDFGLDDGGILQIEEFLNTNVRENPGTLVKEVNAESATTLWSLTWVSGTKQFAIYTTCASARCPTADQVKALAESLPSMPPKLQAPGQLDRK